MTIFGYYWLWWWQFSVIIGCGDGNFWLLLAMVMAIVPFSLGALSQEGVRPLGSADISADLPLPWFVIMVMSLIGDLDNYDHERFYVPDPIAPLLWAFLVANIFDICKNYHKHQDHCCGDIYDLHAWQAFLRRLLISQALETGQVYSMFPGDYDEECWWW